MPLKTDTITLVLMLTDVCNLDCVHCFKSNESLAETPFEDIEKTLLGLKKRFSNLHVSLSGGEATLHRRFEDILSLLNEQNQPYHLVTNGFNFKRRTLPFLLKYKKNLECVAFSVDGANETSHDRIRGKGSFERIINALQLCKENGIGTRICCTLNKWNLNQIDPIRRFAQKHHITNGVYLWTAIPTRRLYEQDLLLDEADRAYLLRRREALECEDVYIIGDLRRMDECYDRCEALSLRQFTLDADGNFSLCCNLTHYANETSREDVLGAVSNTPITTLIERHIDASATYMKTMLKDLNGIQKQDPHAYACTHCARYHNKLSCLEPNTSEHLQEIEVAL